MRVCARIPSGLDQHLQTIFEFFRFLVDELRCSGVLFLGVLQHLSNRFRNFYVLSALDDVSHTIHLHKDIPLVLVRVSHQVDVYTLIRILLRFCFGFYLFGCLPNLYFFGPFSSLPFSSPFLPRMCFLSQYAPCTVLPDVPPSWWLSIRLLLSGSADRLYHRNQAVLQSFQDRRPQHP